MLCEAPRKEARESGGRFGWRGSPATPLALLLLALATLFLFGGGRGHPYQDYSRGHVTLNHMTVALNLSPEHGFLGFYRRYLDDAGEPAYEPYNRFPVLGHALIRLATLPFPDDSYAQLAAARTLMLAFFAAAATLAYLALRRLVRSRWAALAATLLSFSSSYALYYNDMVATEGAVDLFGLMMVLHGMAVFTDEGRFGQLPAKACAALLLGWHAYALLLPFALLGLACALRRRDGRGIRRHLALGAVALGFGSLVLAANFAREYAALGGEVPVAELPSVRSALHRTGVAPVHGFDWTGAAKEQLGRIGAVSVPYALSHFIIGGEPGSLKITKMRVYRVFVALGSVLFVLTVLACLALLLSPPSPRSPLLPLAALALSGPCWMVAMRYAAGEFEGMFHIGIPLALFALLLPRLDRLLGGRARCSAPAGVVAAPLFALSSFLMAQATNPDPGHAAYAKEFNADVDSIRKLAEGKTIFVSMLNACSKMRYWRRSPKYGGERLSAARRERIKMQYWKQYPKYYFTGSVFVGYADRRLADFVVSERTEGARTLTPGNRHAFLYDRASHDAALGRWERRAEHGAPVLESPDWDVHLVKGSAGRHLLYFDDHCPDRQITGGFARFASLRINMGGSQVFLHAWPYDANDLPAGRRRFGFDDLMDGFRIALPGWQKDGGCYALCRLPDYGIARIRTGWAMERSTGEDPPRYDIIWEGSFSPDQATGEVLRSPQSAPVGGPEAPAH